MRLLPRLPALQLVLPLARDGTGRFLPALIAVMVYLAALALAGMIALDGALQRWDAALAGTLTVQLPPGDPAAAERAASAIAGVPGVTRATLVDEAATLKLLEPWLGSGVDPKELALPRLVDLAVAPEARAAPQALGQRIAGAVPGARLDDNRAFIDPLLAAGKAVELVALAVLVLVAGAAILSIVFATRTGLAMHQGTVEVLHLIGARDSYVARQFQWHALRLGLVGGAIGLAAAALTIAGLDAAASSATALPGGAAALPQLRLGVEGWSALLLLLPAAGAVALVTARLTVLRTLGRMP